MYCIYNNIIMGITKKNGVCYIHTQARATGKVFGETARRAPAPAAAAMAWNAARGSSTRAGRAPPPPALRRPRRGPQGPRAARPGRGRAAAAGSAASASARAGGRARGSPRARLGSDRVVASGMEAPSLSHTVCRTAALPRCRFRHGGTESLSDFGMKRMGGGAESGDVAELRTHRGPSQTAGSARRPAPRRRQRLRGRRPGAGGGAPQLTSRG